MAFDVAKAYNERKKKDEDKSSNSSKAFDVAEAYKQVEKVHFDNAYYRKDIGAKALAAKEA